MAYGNIKTLNHFYIIDFGKEIPMEDEDDNDELEVYVQELCDWNYNRNTNENLTNWRYYVVNKKTIIFATNDPIHVDIDKYYNDMRKEFSGIKLMYADTDINVKAYPYFYEQNIAHDRLIKIYDDIMYNDKSHNIKDLSGNSSNIDIALEELEDIINED